MPERRIRTYRAHSVEKARDVLDPKIGRAFASDLGDDQSRYLSLDCSYEVFEQSDEKKFCTVWQLWATEY